MPNKCSGLCSINERDKPVTQGFSAFGEGALPFDVFGLALGGFDGDDTEPEGPAVVGGGLHVEDAGVDGQLETVEEELPRHERPELGRPLV